MIFMILSEENKWPLPLSDEILVGGESASRRRGLSFSGNDRTPNQSLSKSMSEKVNQPINRKKIRRWKTKVCGLKCVPFLFFPNIFGSSCYVFLVVLAPKQ